MIKVFIVEDEVIIRNSIKNNIPWEKEGFQFVGEASDGELAYPLIKKEQPDILITDIKMPFMDGLELSRIVKKEMPDIKIIILSGYNDFDYAKTAIDIGVTDYLLKPVTTAKLLEAVKRVADIIRKEKEQAQMLDRYHKEMEENLNLEKHKLWNTLVSGQLSTAEFLEKGQMLGMDFAAPAYIVLLFKIMQEGDTTGCSREVIEASAYINEMSAGWEHVLSFDRSPEGWGFLIKGASGEEINRTLRECTEALIQAAGRYPQVEYFGGIGSEVNRLGNIKASYQDASRAFSGRFFTRQNQFLRCEDIPKLHTRDDEKIDVSVIPSKKMQRELVEKFLKSGAHEEVDSFLEEYFWDVGSRHFQSVLYRQYVIMDLFFAVMDFLGSMEIDMEKLPPKCRDINGIVERGTTVKAAKEELGDLFRAAIELRDNHSKKKYSKLLEEACDFIRNNYQREDMSLNMVASQVNISPSYFSTIFSGETGQTFVEYLTQVRMDKARELLMCSGMRTAEIGYEVGYKDSHYFSYLFKKVVGCSPKEYKNRRREQ